MHVSSVARVARFELLPDVGFWHLTDIALNVGNVCYCVQNRHRMPYGQRYGQNQRISKNCRNFNDDLRTPLLSNWSEFVVEIERQSVHVANFATCFGEP